MTSGPKVRFGTNWPSMTSHWMRSTPASSSAATPRRGGRSRPAARRGRSRCGGRSGVGRSSPSILARAPLGTYAPDGAGRRSTITTVVAGGDGLARDADGRVVFVAGALPGETVAVEVTERAEGLRPRPSCVEVLDAVARPGRRRRARRGRGLRRVRLAARRRRRPAPPQGGDRRRRPAPSGPPRRRRSALGPTLPADGYRTTSRGVAADGRFGFRQRAQPRRRSPSTRAWSPTRWSTSSSPTGGFPDGEVVAPGRRAHRRAPGRRARRSRPTCGARRTCASSAPTSSRPAAGPGSTRRSPGGAGGSRPGRSSRPAPTAPRPWSTRWPRAGRRRAPDGGRLVDLYAGVGLFAGDARRRTGPVTLVESERARRWPTPGTTWPTATPAIVQGRRRPLAARRRPTWWWPTRPAPASAADGRGARSRPRGASVWCWSAATRRRSAATPGCSARPATSCVGSTLVDLFPHTPHVEVVTRFDHSVSLGVGSGRPAPATTQVGRSWSTCRANHLDLCSIRQLPVRGWAPGPAPTQPAVHDRESPPQAGRPCEGSLTPVKARDTQSAQASSGRLL